MAMIERLWYPPPDKGWGPLLVRIVVFGLLPLSWLFKMVAVRRYRRYLREVSSGSLWRSSVPVIVVGNISVGGTGKTPVVIALVEQLRSMGYNPGVVSRGYGGRPKQLPLSVEATTHARECGDEPLLIHARTGCPVVVDPDRPNAIRHLLVHTKIDVVVSDDGLQHYRMYRDLELAVVDGKRGLGNERCLPAGPLREPPRRLQTVDAVLLNGGDTLAQAPLAARFDLLPATFVNVANGECCDARRFAAEVADGLVVHAVAGIGNPARFFSTLSELGIAAEGRGFPDHHRYRPEDIEFKGGALVLMTEKDAAKCRDFADHRCWYLAVDARLPPEFLNLLEERLARPANL